MSNCHGIARALLADLFELGERDGWVVATGRVRNSRDGKVIEHSWIEKDGWCFDLSKPMIVAMPKRTFRQLRRPHAVRRISIPDYSAESRT